MIYKEDIRFKLKEIDLKVLEHLMCGGTLAVPFKERFKSTDEFCDEVIELERLKIYRIDESMVTGYMRFGVFYELKFSEFIKGIINCPEGVKREAIKDSEALKRYRAKDCVV